MTKIILESAGSLWGKEDMVVEGDWEETGRGNCSQDVISERKKMRLLDLKTEKKNKNLPSVS